MEKIKFKKIKLPKKNLVKNDSIIDSIIDPIIDKKTGENIIDKFKLWDYCKK